METLLQYSNRFFNEHHDFLKNNYPGISVNRIQQELEYYFTFGYESFDHFLNSIYLEDYYNPVTIFFKKLEQGIPFAYISNYRQFYNSDFYINRDVLIPRSETELLVEMAIKELKKIITTPLFIKNSNNKDSNNKDSKQIKVIDIGTGSGCIIVSILENWDNEIHPLLAYATDISLNAIDIAKRNYYLLNYKINPLNKIQFDQRDRLTGLDDNEKFHLIVSNPPYIKKNADMKNVHPQVRLHEPETALYIDDEKYEEWYSVFFEQMYKHLEQDGVFLLEGHENHIHLLKDLATSSQVGFKKCTIVKDLTQTDRFLKLIKQ
ncbi:MAG: peptide chain release factor N(5)-glutamine methyltransferase [Oligoflexia bacterium]|nr:peptide chain release factor N(5)-glutamine methyltransferase [Oligoflexia bacterium]